MSLGKFLREAGMELRLSLSQMNIRAPGLSVTSLKPMISLDPPEEPELLKGDHNSYFCRWRDTTVVGAKKWQSLGPEPESSDQELYVPPSPPWYPSHRAQLWQGGDMAYSTYAGEFWPIFTFCLDYLLPAGCVSSQSSLISLGLRFSNCET